MEKVNNKINHKKEQKKVSWRRKWLIEMTKGWVIKNQNCDSWKK